MQWLFTRRASALSGISTWQIDLAALLRRSGGGPNGLRRVRPTVGYAGRQLCRPRTTLSGWIRCGILRCISPRAELYTLRTFRRRARALGVPIAAEDLARWIRCVVDADAPGRSTIAVASGGDATFCPSRFMKGAIFPRGATSEERFLRTRPVGRRKLPGSGPHATMSSRYTMGSMPNQLRR